MLSTNYGVWLLLGLALGSHACYSIWKIWRHLHILQLNSYFNRRYCNWLIQKRYLVFRIQELEPLLAAVGIFFHKPLVVLALFAIIYGKLFLGRSVKSAKKPLVVTPRIGRLVSANVGLLLAADYGALAVWWHQGDGRFELALVGLVLYTFLVPGGVVLTNWLLGPLERLIQAYYRRTAANYLRTLDHLRVIGITGSFGKTTTKYILTELLQPHFAVLKTPGSYNTLMGVTRVVHAQLKPRHELFVVEMGAKKPGDIREICQVVKPKYGIITAIGEQHLETFGNVETIVRTKGELIDSLPADGVAFFNLDDPYLRDLAGRAQCRVVTYGCEQHEVDYRMTAIKLDADGTSFWLEHLPSQTREMFTTRLLGRANLDNLLAAIAVAAELGIPLAKMVYSVRQLVAVPHRLELKRVAEDIIFIDDAFNSNPRGSQMALEVLDQIAGQRKIIITPGMIELGAKEDWYNEQLGELIAKVCHYVILVGPQQTAAIQRGLARHNYPASQLLIAQDFAEARQHLTQLLRSGDVVLFENDLPDNYCERW